MSVADVVNDAGNGGALVVLASASLRKTFEALAPQFEKAEAGVKVSLTFVEGSELRVRFQKLARVDVVAADDAALMAVPQKKHLIEEPRTFARNEPVIVVPRGNPAQIQGLIYLLQAKRLALGAPSSLIGGHSKTIIEHAGKKFGGGFSAKVMARAVSRQSSGALIVAQVAGGKADAGIAFFGDTLASKDQVDSVALPAGLNDAAECLIAVAAKAHAPALAKAWIDLVLSPIGQRELTTNRFATVAGAN